MLSELLLPALESNGDSLPSSIMLAELKYSFSRLAFSLSLITGHPLSSKKRLPCGSSICGNGHPVLLRFQWEQELLNTSLLYIRLAVV